MYKTIIEKVIHTYSSKNKFTLIGFASTLILVYYLINQLMGMIQLVADVSVFALMIAKLFITIFSNDGNNLKHQLETIESDDIKNLKSLHRSHRLTKRARNEYMESLLKQVFVVFTLRSTIFVLPIISIPLFAVVPLIGIIISSIHLGLLLLMILIQVPVPAINIIIDKLKKELNIVNFDFSFTKPLTDTIILFMKSLISIETISSIQTIQDNVVLIDSKTKLSRKDSELLLESFDRFSGTQKEHSEQSRFNLIFYPKIKNTFDTIYNNISLIK